MAPGTVSNSTGSGTHTYTVPGVYTIEMTLTDDDGGSDSGIFEYVVVFDPDGPFVTGGGHIASPAGAYAPDPSLTGKATFGFVSKFKKGTNEPVGNTEFQFRAAELNFKSDAYEWLVVAGAQAKFKGVGTINGAGNYGFQVFGTDGDIDGGGGADKFRIKIWDNDNGEAVVYDNELGKDIDEDPTTTLTGGSIQIHDPKGQSS